MKSSTIGAIILAVGIGSILIAPWLFTAYSSTFNFHETGQIGDTIGGTTAPIASLVGSILIYLALKAQIEANDLILKSNELLLKSNDLLLKEAKRTENEEIRRHLLDFYNTQLQRLRHDLDNFSISNVELIQGVETREYFTGVHAFAEILNFHQKALDNDPSLFTDDKRLASPELQTFLYFMMHFERLVDNGFRDIRELASLDPNDMKRVFTEEDYLLGDLKFTYAYRLRPPLVKFNFSDQLEGNNATSATFVKIFKIHDKISEVLSL